MLASDLIAQVSTVLHDIANERWSVATHLAHLNAGLLEVVSQRPEAYVLHTPVPVAAGVTRQALPAGALRAIDFTHNLGADGNTPGKAVRMVSRDQIDAMRPTWHADPPGTSVAHCMFDARDPLTFYVYPRQKVATYVAGVLSAAPSLAAATQNLPVSDLYANALVEFCLYKARSLDAEHAANGQLAAAHYQTFISLVTGKGAVDAQFGPNANSPLNPNLTAPPRAE